MFTKLLLCLLLAAINESNASSVVLKYTINQSNNGHQQTNDLACSNDGEYLATIGLSLTSSEISYEVKTWKLSQSLELVNTYNKSNGGHADEINAIINYAAYDNFGIRIFYTASDDKTVKAFDGVGVQTPFSSEFPLESTNIALTKDSEGIIVGFRDGSVLINNPSVGETTIKDAKSQFFVVVSDKYLASVSQPPFQNKIDVWEIETGKLHKTFDESNGGHFSSISKILDIGDIGFDFATGDEEGLIKIWITFPQVRLLFTLNAAAADVSGEVSSNKILDLAYLSGGFLASTTLKSLKVWDVVNNGQLKYTIQHSLPSSSPLLGPSSFYRLALFEKDLLAVSDFSFAPYIFFYDFKTGELKHKVSHSNGQVKGSLKGLVSCGKNYLASFNGEDIKIWEVKADVNNSSEKLLTFSQFALFLFSMMIGFNLIF